MFAVFFLSYKLTNFNALFLFLSVFFYKHRDYKKTILARSGDEGYVLIPLKPTAGAKSINASILQDGVVKDSRVAEIG